MTHSHTANTTDVLINATPSIDKITVKIAQPRDRKYTREELYTELMPLIQRLICRCGKNPVLREELSDALYGRYCALFDAYDPESGVPMHGYMVRRLSAFADSFTQQRWQPEPYEMGRNDRASAPAAAASSDRTEHQTRLGDQSVTALSMLRHGLVSLRKHIRPNPA